MLLKEGNVIGDYKLEKQIGYGGYGKVFKAQHIKTQEIKALKAITIMEHSDSSSNENSQELKIGIEIGRKCEFLVHYDSVFIYGDFQCLTMEYFEKGDLQKYINNGNRLSEKEIIKLTYQITISLSALHDRNIIHRDLKLGNIFITSDGNFKLGDYGISRKEGISMTGQVGTEGYQAPEIMDGEKYGKSADIYSLGIIIYILISGGKYPFVNAQGKFSMLKAASGKYDMLLGKDIDEELKELCYKMIQLKPDDRPTTKQILENPFLNKILKQEEKEEKIDELKNEINELKKEINELKKGTNELNEEMKKVKDENMELKKMNNEKDEEIERLRKQLESGKTDENKKGEELEKIYPSSTPLFDLITFIKNNPKLYSINKSEIAFHLFGTHEILSFVFKNAFSNCVVEIVGKVKYVKGDRLMNLGVLSVAQMKSFKSAYTVGSCEIGSCFQFNEKHVGLICNGRSSDYFSGIGGVPQETEIKWVLDSRVEECKGKGTLKMLVGGKMIPYAITNIPCDGVHIGFSCQYSDYTITIISLTKLSVSPPSVKCTAYDFNWDFDKGLLEPIGFV